MIRLRKGKDKAMILLRHNCGHNTTLASSQGSGTTGNEGNQKARAKGPDQSFRKRGVASIGQEGGACADVCSRCGMTIDWQKELRTYNKFPALTTDEEEHSEDGNSMGDNGAIAVADAPKENRTRAKSRAGTRKSNDMFVLVWESCVGSCGENSSMLSLHAIRRYLEFHESVLPRYPVVRVMFTRKKVHMCVCAYFQHRSH